MMNSRHLPAGQQNMPPDMRGGGASGGGGGGGRRYAQTQHQQQYPPIASGPGMYNNGYMNQYNVNANYYPPPQQHLPPQYHNPYQYAGSQPYAGPPSYPAVPHQPYPAPRSLHSPALRSTPYQAPQMPQIPPQAPIPQASPAPLMSPAPRTPPVLSSYSQPSPPMPSTPESLMTPPASSPLVEVPKKPSFLAPLPWCTCPEEEFPARRPRRKRRPIPPSAEDVHLPPNPAEAAIEESMHQPIIEKQAPRPETPSSNFPASEQDSTNPTTPSSQHHPSLATPGETTPLAKTNGPPTRQPIVPAIPKALPREVSSRPMSAKTQDSQSSAPAEVETIVGNDVEDEGKEEPKKEVKPAPKAWSTPKAWSDLLKQGAKPAPVVQNGTATATPESNVGKSNAQLFAEALGSFSAMSNDAKVAFLEPRGLVNSGNMCYMNSVLQVLVFCAPFFNFLDLVGKRATHSFKSDTPLIDAMIMFKSEYRVIDSAPSVEKLRLRLKDGELEEYGKPFTPDFVYNAMKNLPRFVSMQRGHQQDAEEFLGFLLEGLNEECVRIMRSNSSSSTSAVATPTNAPASPVSDFASVSGSVNGKDNGWHEVGPKQRAAVTQSSGTIEIETPITKIFGGDLRSDLKVPGLMDSVTHQPYQTLQLDIGSPDVHNIVDALKGLTGQELMKGDFKSPKGPNVTATKQVFIEKLPPVLILHLKRFQYDKSGGTQKIWTKVGYPLELEIPKEVFSRQKRNTLSLEGLPKYRLMAVVYHHGKNASGGHYTVDVRRQDGREWVRLDDKEIKRVRSEDVAEGGSEEDPKVLAAALDAHAKNGQASGNSFAAIEDGDEAAEESGWKQASGPGRKWSSVVNGASTPKSKAESRFSTKDAKVAYLLFYQRI